MFHSQLFIWAISGVCSLAPDPFAGEAAPKVGPFRVACAALDGASGALNRRSEPWSAWGRTGHTQTGTWTWAWPSWSWKPENLRGPVSTWEALGTQVPEALPFHGS